MSGACARRVALLLALLVCAAPAARAQRVLARTAALSATRQAAALYMHSLDFGRGGALPGVNRLPGSSATAPLLLWESGRRCVAGSGPAHPPQRPEPGDPDTVISLARTAPFQLVEPAVYRSEPGWREWPANLRGNGDRCLLAVLGGLETPERGRLRLLSFDENGMAPVPVREWGLPGGAVGAVFTASAAAPGGLLPTVAVLCRGPTGAPPVLALCDPVSGRITRHSMVELPGWNPVCVEPDAIASPPNGAWVAVSLSGTDLDLGTGEPVSQVAFFDPVRRAWAGAPVRVQGVVGPEGLRSGYLERMLSQLPSCCSRLSKDTPRALSSFCRWIGRRSVVACSSHPGCSVSSASRMRIIGTGGSYPRTSSSRICLE